MPEATRTTHGTVRDMFAAGNRSAWSLYRALTFADAGFWRFVLFELASMFILPMPGAAGLFLRRRLMRRFFGSFGRNVIIGRNCVFRHPNRILLGDSVSIDDNCVVDARGCGREGLRIGDGTIVSRGCTIKSKQGDIVIGRRVAIGGSTQIISHAGIEIGDDTGIGGACQINGGTFDFDEFNKPPPERKPMSRGPIRIGKGSWLATGVLVLDAASVGDGAVVSAGSVVTQAVQPLTVVHGNPARKVFVIR
jgi:acetyltransferase-like isoleucine patch superfamily enzyme